MNNLDAQGADPVDPALLAVPPQQPPQRPNPLLMQPPPGIGGESNYRAFYTDQSKDPRTSRGATRLSWLRLKYHWETLHCSPLSNSLLEFTSQVIKVSICTSSCTAVLPIPQQKLRDIIKNVYHRVSCFVPGLGCSPHLGMMSLLLSKVMLCNIKRPHPLFGIKITSIQSYR